ncbi:MAG: TIGR01459 family HAD-type hydrolase [Pseudomonadota bacterium]
MTTPQSPTGRIRSLGEVRTAYGNIICDVWGVLHNGVRVYDHAAQALIRYRQQGGRVVMITNSPRPADGVIKQFAELGVPEGVFDAVVTSGDATRHLIARTEGPFYHLGPQRDLPLFDTLDIKLVDEEACAAIVCTGLEHDEKETPEDYRARLQGLVDRGVPMICANPDIVVERGDRLIYCAGALAQLYEKLGGTTLVAGKPNKPIYDLAMEQLAAIAGAPQQKADTLAIGDGMPTDVKGAQDNGFPLLYISAGIHSADYGPADAPDEDKLHAFLKDHGADPTVWMPRLVWID